MESPEEYESEVSNVAADEEGDDSVHEPGDGTEDAPEPGAGLGDEVEEPDPESAA